ncbi:branched-chain amino acid transport system substrate-binding protein [Azospirillum brasilense]|uniref:Branched-chain amino acid transport system substrate-binding protein n=1 Tax=Azospirillum brasilense TaxID=192 RepID=A0A560ASY9_AZOBR|nr:ABC transporter substrate-binding protein [Azospirillum brasilense]TWA63471.1 branched-chain amino acid transport system substrate-binding protein [Azospirillum brasilense]
MKTLAVLATSLVALTQVAFAQGISDNKVKIGVITDLSGVYTDIAGNGSVVAAELAAEDFGGKVKGVPIEIIKADHQNKADIASSVVQKWFDTEQVDAIADMVTSSVGLALQQVAVRSKKVALNTGAGTSGMTNASCSPYGVSWVYDTYSLATVNAKATLQSGGDTWFFITADYAFGHDLENDVRKVLEANGGKVVGSVRHPFPTQDMSSYLLQAQASGAKVIALANAGQDTITAIKQAKEFGILDDSKVKVVALLAFEPDIRAIGLSDAAGILMSSGFIWNRTPETTAWSDRFHAKTGKRPTSVQAGTYSAVLHYLKAVEATGTDNADTVMEAMRATPVKDMFADGGAVRADGRMLHEMYLVQVKKPEESRDSWDLFKVVGSVPGEQAFRPVAESQCPLLKK